MTPPSVWTSLLMVKVSGPPVEVSASTFLNLQCYLLSDKRANISSVLALYNSSAIPYFSWQWLYELSTIIIPVLKMGSSRHRMVVQFHKEMVVTRFKAKSSGCIVWTLILLSFCPFHTSLVSLFVILSLQSWVSLAPNEIARVPIPRVLSQPVPPSSPSSLNPSPGGNPRPLAFLAGE